MSPPTHYIQLAGFPVMERGSKVVVRVDFQARHRVYWDISSLLGTVTLYKLLKPL